MGQREKQEDSEIMNGAAQSGLSVDAKKKLLSSEREAVTVLEPLLGHRGLLKY